LVILGGDLNFSLGLSEVWGLHARVDPLAGYFGQKLVDCKLIDLEPTLLKPTWRNNRVGEDGVAKRMDHFLIADSFLEKQLTMKQWIGSGGISDHYPIFFEFRQGPKNPASPFKFNKTWLEDESFINLVKENWIPFHLDSHQSTTFHFVENLKRIKEKVKPWDFQKRQNEDKELKEIESELQSFSEEEGGGGICHT
jgi:hypothetical protein